MVRGRHGSGSLLATSLVPTDLDSSDSSLRSDDEDSILALLAAPPPRSMRRLPRPLVQGVVSSTSSCQRALLQDSRLGVVSSDSVSVSLNLICVKDPGSSPSSCWTSPSSGPDSPRSLPASSDSVGVMSLSGVVPLVWGRRTVDRGPGGCPSPGPWYWPYCFRRVRLAGRPAPIQLVELSPLVQFEPYGIFFPPEPPCSDHG